MHLQYLGMLCATRSETLALTSTLTQRQCDFVPAPGKWSAGEVLDHLRLSDDLYRERFARLIDLEVAGKLPVVNEGFEAVNTSVAYIPKSALPALEIPFTVLNLFVPGFVRDWMTEFRLLPAQNPDIAKPRPGQPVEELREALRRSLDRTESLLAAHPAIDYRRLRYQHPLMGDNSLPMLLRILALHERRHQSQIRDILGRRDFPPSAPA